MRAVLLLVAATLNTVEGANAHPDLTPAAASYVAANMGSRVDAVMTIAGNVGPNIYMHNKAYIFKGSQYVKWDLNTDTFYSGPFDISSNWGGHFSHVDAVMTIVGNVGPSSYMHNKAYFFFGSQYVQWDLNGGGFELGPFDISSHWGGHFSHVDAVMTIVGNVGPNIYMHNKAYIFFGSQYVKWDLNTDTFYSGPFDISSNWGHFSHVDAVMTIVGNVGPSYMHNMAYIFFGSQYVKWDLNGGGFYSGPKDIDSNFGGIPTVSDGENLLGFVNTTIAAVPMSEKAPEQNLISTLAVAVSGGAAGAFAMFMVLQARRRFTMRQETLLG